MLGNENTDKTRLEKDKIAALTYDSTEAQDRIIVDRVAEIAEKHGVKRAQIALAWLLHKDGVASALVGATSVIHVEEAIPAIEIVLTAEEIAYLEEPYVPHKLSGVL